PVFGRKLDNSTAVHVLSRARRHNETRIPRLGKIGRSAFDLVGVAHVDGADLYPQRLRQCLNSAELADRRWSRRIANDGHSRQLRHNLLEALQPLSAQTIFKVHEPGNVAPRPRDRRHESGPHWIGDLHEHDRYRLRDVLCRRCAHGAACEENVGRECNQLYRILARAINVVLAPANLDTQVAALGPSQLLQAGVPFCICSSRVHEHANPPHALVPLCARRQRPRDCRAAENRYELAPPHSITSSARASRLSGTVRPSALAVLRLIASSYLVGACTGSSAGFSPLRMRSTYSAARRYWSTKSGP